jgi:nicotinamide riboside transporter PnuC
VSLSRGLRSGLAHDEEALMYWIVSVAALIGVVLNIRKHVACFYVWSCTNAAWCYADFEHGLHAQGALMSVYFVLSLWGIWTWTRSKKGETRGKENPC